MNYQDQWKETVDLELAWGDLAAARKLMADPTPNHLAKVSKLLHGVRQLVDE